MSGSANKGTSAEPFVRGVVAVVVTFFPSSTLRKNVEAILSECDLLVVVDNGSPPTLLEGVAAIPNVELIFLGENRGIAAALNRGMERAEALGAGWALTFDQDSCPLPGFVDALLATQSRIPNAAVIGARIEEEGITREPLWLTQHPRWPVLFRRVDCMEGDLRHVTIVVTSGSLTNVDSWRTLGGFDESLFIDFVDTDFCLRCREAGREIAVSANARLKHRLGRRETRRFLGLTFHPTHHAPFRHYYIARNRVSMVRRHGRRELHWLCFELAVVGLWFFRVMIFEHERLAKLRAMLVGTCDGLRKLSGAAREGRHFARPETG